jgi:hypothetical protein
MEKIFMDLLSKIKFNLLLLELILDHLLSKKHLRPVKSLVKPLKIYSNSKDPQEHNSQLFVIQIVQELIKLYLVVINMMELQVYVKLLFMQDL